MNCLQNLSRSIAASPLQANLKSPTTRRPSILPQRNTLVHHNFNSIKVLCTSDLQSHLILYQFVKSFYLGVALLYYTHLYRRLQWNKSKGEGGLLTFSSPASSAEMSGSQVKEDKSDVYSADMTQAMGAVLTYRHELGMNYNYILPDLIVGSCLQTPEDVDKLRSIGVKTIFCLQQNSDLEYFSVDIIAIQEYAEKYDDINHLRAEIRDFDSFDLRLRLPAVLSKLYKAVNRNGGVTYIHCTAGLGRAPAVALAYMFWALGYKLNEAHDLLLSKRSCFPKLDAIRSATADILTGLNRSLVTLKWEGSNCSSVEISGLDIGWGQRVPLRFDKEKGLWITERELPEGSYEYKYIVDGKWMHSEKEPVTKMNKDGHINNYVQVLSKDLGSYSQELRERLASADGDLTKEERVKIRQFLESYPDQE